MEKINISKKNVATTNRGPYEFVGTIAMDLPKTLDELIGESFNGYHIIGLRLNLRNLHNINPDTVLKVDVILKANRDSDKKGYGFVERQIAVSKFIEHVVEFSVQISDTIHFERDEVDWSNLKNIDQKK